ncbi:MAG TPA: hypothetical protein P5064_04150 [Clostridia bacterium]|jgi:hypothetical protein|nr:hypothetical protein [Clostridiaceae bacterium]HOF26018.1 hypothetical protein [Clostridia bacterium]HOM33539.1 hypothetical protein [Clostridia bacterium]HOR89195.1 hypothetical protein [Clostridia bacterium]HOT70107.1 hypothetical protein [Clostridia bacterium]
MDNTMNEYEIIEQMEDLVTSAKQTVFSDRISISKDEMLDLIYYLKNAIKQRDQEEEAKNKELLRMISEAKNRESDADDQSVVLEDANREANEIKRAALKYADNLLASVQESIEKTLNIIASNREELDQ